MSAIPRKVLLCKSKAPGDQEDGENSYSTVLEASGFTCDLLSVLQFKFINLDELRSMLLTPDSHSGLILTSPRSAEAVGLALGRNEAETERIFQEIWRDLPVYCVGSATDRAARDLLALQNCWGMETGSAKELAELIVRESRSKRDFDDGKPLLYPCSLIARDTVVSTLDSAGIPLRKLAVYQTLPSKTLETDLTEILDKIPPEYIVLFSPSAVKHVVHVIRQSNHSRLIEQIKFVAIGPVTQQAIVDAGLEVYATSRQPEPVALCDALINRTTIR